MFNPKTFANSRPDGIGVLGIVGENGDRPAPPHMFVPLKRTELSGEVTGPPASMRLRRVYGYSGARPLNLSRKRGEALRLALADPAGFWSGGAPDIEVALE